MIYVSQKQKWLLFLFYVPLFLNSPMKTFLSKVCSYPVEINWYPVIWNILLYYGGKQEKVFTGKKCRKNFLVKYGGWKSGKRAASSSQQCHVSAVFEFKEIISNFKIMETVN